MNASGGVDPKAKAEYEKIYNECGGNYDTIAAKLGVTWAVRSRAPPACLALHP